MLQCLELTCNTASFDTHVPNQRSRSFRDCPYMLQPTITCRSLCSSHTMIWGTFDPRSQGFPKPKACPMARKDFPRVGPYTTGSLENALQIAGCKHSRASASAAFTEKIKAPSAVKSSLSLLATWETVCGKAGVSPYTFSPTELISIAAIFDQAGYRSTMSYVSAAKLESVRRGNCWTQQL